MPYEHAGPLFFLWFIALALFIALTKADEFKGRPELKRHLVHGPIFFLVALPVLFALYQVYLVRQSERRILAYIQGTGPSVCSYEFRPHLIFWSRRCGNANEGLVFATYGTAAASGLDSSDRQVRARSLRATLWFYDGPRAPVFGYMEDVIRKARTFDLDPETRDLLLQYRLPEETPTIVPGGVTE
jgi:hypothetical protein